MAAATGCAMPDYLERPMLRRLTTTFLASLCVAAMPITAQAGSLPDDHAPIGVMGDHNHSKGEWMFSYRYGNMYMDGNRSGTDSVSTADVLAGFMVAPLDMRMQMHMFGAMYAPSDTLTLMAMTSYNQKSMNHINRMGMRFSTETEGFGDTKLSGLYTLYDSGLDEDSQRTRHKLLLNLGVSLPTGSITERDATPMGPDQKLPYPMQLGSGTYDPLLGLTYMQKHALWSWGGQVNTALRFGKNSEGYRLGHEYGATAWVARDLSRHVSLSLRLDGKAWGDIKGADRDLMPMMVPTARTDLRAGERVDALIGVNYYQPDGIFANHRLAAEFGMPVYQRLDGPQMETDYRFMLGWQYAF